jgi:hypothetical protein
MKVYVTCDPIIFSSLLVKYFPRPEEEQLSYQILRALQ